MALKCLRELFRWLCRAASPAPSSALPSDIEGEEPLVRFILDRKLFSPKDDRVKPKAFEPPRNLRLSVFRTIRLTDGEIWLLGETFVGKPQQRDIKAAATIDAASVFVTGLRIEADDKPPRHANIINWPESKDERLSIQQRLAACAKLSLPPDA